MTDEGTFEVSIDLESGYRFRADMGDVPALYTDEPPPLGEGKGPNAARILAAAVGTCMSASLALCLRKARIDVKGIHSTVRATVRRNENGRLRIAEIAVQLEPEVDVADEARMKRCIEIFEDYCVVARSISDGIDVSSEVRPRAPAIAAGV